MAFLLSLAMLVLSCRGGANVEGLISTDPTSITAGWPNASFDIELKCNVDWKAEIRNSDGSDAIWIGLNKISGSGDAKVSVTIFENKYSTMRTAQIAFVTEGGKESLVDIQQAGKAGGADTGKINIRVGSYNLRVSSLDKDEDNTWAARNPRLLQSIMDNNFDVFGIQEADLSIQTWLKNKFSNTYNFLFFSPYSQSGVGDKAQGILYRKDMFTADQFNFFWASSTPETSTVNDTGDRGDFRRGGCCVVLTYKDNGMKLFFMNTHGCLNRAANDAAASVYESMEKKFNKEGLPSFFVGDMNARPDYPAIQTYKRYWSDSYETAVKRSGAPQSYNGYSNSNGKYRIDFIFHRGDGITVNEFQINNKLYDSKYASDHFPLWADVTIVK